MTSIYIYSLEPRLSVPDFVSHFCASCETKSGTESLGSRLQYIRPADLGKQINFVSLKIVPGRRCRKFVREALLYVHFSA